MPETKLELSTVDAAQSQYDVVVPEKRRRSKQDTKTRCFLCLQQKVGSAGENAEVPSRTTVARLLTTPRRPVRWAMGSSMPSLKGLQGVAGFARSLLRGCNVKCAQEQLTRFTWSNFSDCPNVGFPGVISWAEGVRGKQRPKRT
ncbi:hypothetical protein NL676_004582 [Syzygium grande]|nr:hypothetical protein NL676_004582 [Syzygium grande]